MDGMEKLKRVPADVHERATGPGSAIILAAGLFFLIVQFLPGPRLWLILPAACLFIAAVLFRDLPAVHFALLTAAIVLVPLLHPLLRTWPFHLLLATMFYFFIVLSFPRMRRGLVWLRPGRLNRPVIFGIIATSLVSAGALYGWYRLLKPDLAIHLAHIPAMPASLLPLAGLGFACGNAALEELAFRGVVLQAFESAAGYGWTSLCCQAALFGAMHFREGFPNRAWGLAMTFIYGLMLGVLRRQSRGMLAPWLAHVCADSAIFVILAAQL
jgi:membrane protease YdiL (CAAX protease family)